MPILNSRLSDGVKLTTRPGVFAGLLVAAKTLPSLGVPSLEVGRSLGILLGPGHLLTDIRVAP